MAQLTAEQATQLANHFLGLAQAIGDFRYANWETLSQEENKKLATSQAAILKSGEDIFALSATLIMTDVQTSLLQIKSLTQQIKSTITHLKDIQKAINVATSIVNLGVVIVTINPQGIVNGITGVVNAWGA